MASQLSLSLIAAPDAVRLEARDVEGYEFTLGRGHDVDWSLLDPDRNILSRRHCVLVQEDGDWWVEDLSGNGTYLNHATTPIGPGARQRLRDGDRVRLGPYEFQVSLTTARPAPSFAAEPADPWTPPASAGTGGRPPFGDDDDPPSGSSAPVSPFPMKAPSHQGGGANPFLDGGSGGPAWDEPAEDVWPPPLMPAPGVPTPGVPPGSPLGTRTADAWPPLVEPGPPDVPPQPTTRGPVNPSPPSAQASEQTSGLNPFVEPVDSAPPNQRDTRPPIGVEPIPVAATPAPGAAEVPRPAVTTAPPVPDRLLPALLEGAGLPDAQPRDPEDAMRALGAAFRAMVKGLRDAQRERQDMKYDFHLPRTQFTQNPLKYAISDDDALEALLGAGRRGGVSPSRAVEEILREIIQHERAVFVAMQDAVRTLVADLSPERLRAQAEQAAGLTMISAQRKARAWDLYQEEHKRVAEGLRDDFDSVFGKAFARAYERVVSEQGP